MGNCCWMLGGQQLVLDAFWWMVDWVMENFRPKYKIFRQFNSNLPCLPNKNIPNLQHFKTLIKATRIHVFLKEFLTKSLIKKHLCISKINYIISAKYKFRPNDENIKHHSGHHSQGDLTTTFHFCSNLYLQQGTIQ